MDYTHKESKLCINCNKYGHTCKHCHQPITSFGIINLKKVNNELYYLMICRKDTFNYVEFLRGRYEPNDVDYLGSLLEGMTISERELIINNDFDFLWNKLWIKKSQERFNKEYYNSKKKFNFLKKDSYLHDLNLKVNFIWSEPEWGFPKGRRNLGESDKDCAIREFEEETGIKNGNYIILNDVRPVKEIFFGTNGNKYKHVYYVSVSKKDIIPSIDPGNFLQVSEISSIQWFTFENCLQKIRHYNKEKIKMFTELNNFLKKKNIDINYINGLFNSVFENVPDQPPRI